MNNTNRALNRTLLLISGTVLLAAGVVLAGLVLVPGWSDTWSEATSWIKETATSAISSTSVPPLAASWLYIALPAVALLLSALLLGFILDQGRGRTRTLLTSKETAARLPEESGTMEIDSAVAESAIGRRLDESPALASASVSGQRFSGGPALKITAVPAPTSTLSAAQRQIEETIRAWDVLIGHELPVLIHFKAGFGPNRSTRVR